MIATVMSWTRIDRIIISTAPVGIVLRLRRSKRERERETQPMYSRCHELRALKHGPRAEHSWAKNTPPSKVLEGLVRIHCVFSDVFSILG